MLVDSHCHLERLKLAEGDNLAAALERAKDRGIERFLCVCVTLEGFPTMMDAIRDFDEVAASCGVHPLDQKEAQDLDRLFELSLDPKVVAIGETGLDYFYAPETAELQKASFRHHIRVARQRGLPLIIHTRDAKEDTLNILREEKAEEVGGVLHCFTEDLDMAQQAIELGFYISISGIVTFRNAEALREVVKALPLERLLVETDSPYLAPVPHRGKSNEPQFVRDVAEFVAKLKGVSLDELSEATTANFQRCFPATQALFG
ncbi:YchF/TatD family DNA exonuclease [Gallaecimonas kandeliae]|uniref:TatD family hydrolase n=1 Tax=Gallaecimonas kandeliae TaxID=3029055 RepID=UPI002649FB84|nr:YchF/TatD family DNA exonuclease [Gallaecimonas kandeliae]WKE67383.1 YchF/TatD family DNA exonuclease [Gallaecimonas kandeliae]